MLISTIDQSLFERIKTEQSLNVTFPGFVEHFLKILDATKRNELHCALIIGSNNRQHQHMQFYERRSFRNLIHLALPIEVASEKCVLHYIQQSLLVVQQQSAGLANQAQRLQSDIVHRDKQILDLRNELQDLNAKLTAQENQILLRNSEHVKRLQTDIQLLNEAKEVEVRKLSHSIKTLQDTVDYMTNEKYLAAEKHNHDVKKFDSVREELKQLKHTARSSHEEMERMRQELATLKASDRKSEHLLTEQRKQMADLRDQLQADDKQRSEMAAELEAEKHIARTKRMALELATEEISKANSIIIKQSKELSQLSQKVDWRTEVALQQEKRMKEVEAEVLSLRKRCQMAEEAGKENSDVGGELRKLREETDELNRKYNRSEFGVIFFIICFLYQSICFRIFLYFYYVILFFIIFI